MQLLKNQLSKGEGSNNAANDKHKVEDDTHSNHETKTNESSSKIIDKVFWNIQPSKISDKVF